MLWKIIYSLARGNNILIHYHWFSIPRKVATRRHKKFWRTIFTSSHVTSSCDEVIYLTWLEFELGYSDYSIHEFARQSFTTSYFELPRYFVLTKGSEWWNYLRRKLINGLWNEQSKVQKSNKSINKYIVFIIRILKFYLYPCKSQHHLHCL